MAATGDPLIRAFLASDQGNPHSTRHGRATGGKDAHIVTTPERAGELCEAYQHAPWTHAHVELNHSRTILWNAAEK